MVFATLSHNHLNHCHVVTQGPAGGASGNPMWHMLLEWSSTLLLLGDGMSILLRTGAGTMPAATQPHSPMTPRIMQPSGPVYISPSCFMPSMMGETPPTKSDPSRTLCPALPCGLGALPWLTSQSTFSKIPDWAVPLCMHVTASQLKKVVHVPACWWSGSQCTTGTLLLARQTLLSSKAEISVMPPSIKWHPFLLQVNLTYVGLPSNAWLTLVVQSPYYNLIYSMHKYRNLSIAWWSYICDWLLAKMVSYMSYLLGRAWASPT